MVSAGNEAWPRVEKSGCGEDVGVTNTSLTLLFPLEGCSEGVESSQGGL